MMKSDTDGPTASIANIATDAATGEIHLSDLVDEKPFLLEIPASIAMTVLLGTMDAVAQNIRRTSKLGLKPYTLMWKRSWKKNRIHKEWTLSLYRKRKVRYLYMNFKDPNDGKYR